MRRVRIYRMTGGGNVMLTESVKEYYSLTKKNEVREAAKKLRRKFLRYKDAEIVYSMSHKMLLERASKAGAIY